MSKRYTLTAALPYTNGPIHIGHLAGVYIPADIYARFKRLKGDDVVFICGSDEHGVPITLKAKNEGVSPKIIVDRYHKIIKDSFKEFGISFDNYSRTSSEIHHETASSFFKSLSEKGEFIVETSDQLYDSQENQFLADRFVVGTCPKCGNNESYGDQCEACGVSHNATDLISPRSTVSGNKPVLKSTKHWYLPLERHQQFLSNWIGNEHKHDWKSNVYGQCMSWIKDGLRSRAVTRDLDWGVPVPLNEAKGKVLYVWFDAPIGYISSTKEWAKSNGKDWKLYWKDKNTKLIHFIGKDNIVFHCIIFPSMLKAEGSYILPTNVPANEFLNLEGRKLSTSKNWAVWLHEYLIDFPDQQDVLRYVLTATAPETKDNDFTWKDFQSRNNNELVAIFGNFVNRVLVLTHKYYNGRVPDCKMIKSQDLKILDTIKSTFSEIESSLDRFRFREASQHLMNLARTGNKYLADQEPWKLIKSDPTRVKVVMNTALQIVASLAVISEPFIPFTSEKLCKILNFKIKPNWSDILNLDKLLMSGHVIEKPSLLFSRIDDDKIQNQISKLMSTNENLINDFSFDAQKESIPFEDFSKMDFRVGTILEAEKIPKANKLLALKVDTGSKIISVVSGIAMNYSLESVVGVKVVVLCNLKPRFLRGVESQGMILMTKDDQGKPIFVSPDSFHKVSPGSVIN